jgi:hypothetical protein
LGEEWVITVPSSWEQVGRQSDISWWGEGSWSLECQLLRGRVGCQSFVSWGEKGIISLKNKSFVQCSDDFRKNMKVVKVFKLEFHDFSSTCLIFQNNCKLIKNAFFEVPILSHLIITKIPNEKRSMKF